MKKKLYFLTLMLTVSLLLGGCKLLDNILGKKVELNERQCEILWSMDLPAEWDELTLRQQESIVAIEEMLEYLEDKYDKEFVYAGYRYPDPLFNDEESLLAYAKGDDPDTQTISVTRTEDGFEDTYDWVLLAPKYQAEMEEKLAPILEGQTYKMYTELTGVKDGKVTAADVNIYIESVDLDVSNKLMDNIVNTLSDEASVDVIRMYRFSDRITSNMNKKNYEDCFDLDDIKTLYRSSKQNRNKNGRRWEIDD